MNAADKHTLLINNLLDLEESAVLAQVQTALQNGEDPLEIIEDAQQAMHLVGRRYEEGQYYISSMMMAGEIFREIMEIVEPALLQKTPQDESGHILLGTVQGDIHEIGKNIFGILLHAQGFKVTDIGVDVSPTRFVEGAMINKPDIIALSGLLTISYESMKKTVEQINKTADLQIAQTPVIIGGGTINEMVAAFVGADYWAIDAMMGVQICKQIMEEKRQAWK